MPAASRRARRADAEAELDPAGEEFVERCGRHRGVDRMDRIGAHRHQHDAEVCGSRQAPPRLRRSARDRTGGSDPQIGGAGCCRRYRQSRAALAADRRHRPRPRSAVGAVIATSCFRCSEAITRSSDGGACGGRDDRGRRHLLQSGRGQHAHDRLGRTFRRARSLRAAPRALRRRNIPATGPHVRVRAPLRQCVLS